MQSKASTVEQYLAELPDDRRAAINAVRKVILANLDKDYREGMQYGMIGYAVPHSVFPAGYHCDPKQPLPFGGLASQKNGMSLYLMCLYFDSPLLKWFTEAWARTGKKLDMGKSCIRFKKVDDLALDVLAEVIRRVPAKTYIEKYVTTLATPRPKPAASGGKSKKPAASSPKKKAAKPAAKRASGTKVRKGR